jgi:anaerobic C4-dicarboxylate transporter
VGVIGGLAIAAVLFLLLRFDPTTIPAFSATGIVLATMLRAAQVGTPSAYASGAIAIATTLAIAWLVTRYLRLPLAPATPVTAAVASPSTA